MSLILTLQNLLHIGGRKRFLKDRERFHETIVTEGVSPHFIWNFQHFRNRRQLSDDLARNLMPTESLNYCLNALLRNQTRYAAWYMGTFSDDYDPVLGDTMAAFPGAATEITAYVSATRPAVTFAAPSSGATDNSAAKCSFVANHASGLADYYGGFLSNNSAKSSTTNILLSAAQLDTAPRQLYPDDELKIAVGISLANA